MKWAGEVARMRESRGVHVYRVLVGNLKERNHLVDPGVDGRIILRRIFRKWDVRVRTVSMWLCTGTDGSHV
jgi:hypothetical protein